MDRQDPAWRAAWGGYRPGERSRTCDSRSDRSAIHVPRRVPFSATVRIVSHSFGTSRKQGSRRASWVGWASTLRRLVIARQFRGLAAHAGDRERHRVGKPVKVFIANFGRENLLWPSCLARSTIATYDDEDLWPYVQSGDREAYIAACMASKTSARNFVPTKQVASRWFNLGRIVSETEGDLWIHREKAELWWTTSRPGEADLSLEPAPWASATAARIYVRRKPADPWTNTTLDGALLLWARLHAKAREFLFTEGTLQELAPANAEYARALVAGRDLRAWHAQPLWGARAAAAGHGAVTTFGPRERAAAVMARRAEETAKASMAPPSLQAPKRKEFRFASSRDLQQYILARIDEQQGLCAITGLPLQFPGSEDDPELLCSLDRIDSDGHYEPGNLQVVCKFVNRWKSSEPDHSFRRLVNLIRGTGY
jgi:hypothetical protein